MAKQHHTTTWMVAFILFFLTPLLVMVPPLGVLALVGVIVWASTRGRRRARRFEAARQAHAAVWGW